MCSCEYVRANSMLLSSNKATCTKADFVPQFCGNLVHFFTQAHRGKHLQTLTVFILLLLVFKKKVFLRALNILIFVYLVLQPVNMFNLGPKSNYSVVIGFDFIILNVLLCHFLQVIGVCGEISKVSVFHPLLLMSSTTLVSASNLIT